MTVIGGEVLTIAPVLSVAVSVKVPVVPVVKPTGLAVTVNEVPLPVSGAGVENDNQEVPDDAVQVTGREQVPVSLSEIVFDTGDVCP